jgi:hypothetical protein
LADLEKQHIRHGDHAMHAAQLREAKQEALNDLAAALNGANDEERAAITAAIAKIEGRESKATVAKKGKR